MTSSRNLVDLELLSDLDSFPTFDLHNADLPSLRRQFDDVFGSLPFSATLGVNVAEHEIATLEGHMIGVLVFTPHGAASSRPAVLHLHGGGYVVGSAKGWSAANREIAVAADCIIVSVDYRLAPETRHPGPVEDCYAALTWIHDNADALGADLSRIAVMGESAGGGLAAALALLARDRGAVRLVHQHLIYPMIDDRTCTRNPHPFAGEFRWTTAHNRFGWASLLGEDPGGEHVSPYAAAARAEDLAGLPSTFISVGALDLFVDENIDYARRLIRAGVPTELHVYPGAYHGFDLAAEASVSKAAARRSLEALRRALHPG